MVGQIPKFDFLWKPYNVCVNNLLKSCLIPFIIKRFFHHFFHDHTILLFCSLSLFSHILFLVRFCLEFSVQRLILCRVILPFCTHIPTTSNAFIKRQCQQLYRKLAYTFFYKFYSKMVNVGHRETKTGVKHVT